MDLALIKTWEIIDNFKTYCKKTKNWKTYEYDDLIQIGQNLTKFIWIRNLNPDTFKEVSLNQACIIRMGNAYKKTKILATAWLLPETPFAGILQILEENPDLLRTNAIYDLSCAFKGESICLKLNKTKNEVLQEFEKFLYTHYCINTEPLFKYGTAKYYAP